jgi:steroid delta-isomerase-like uncharacterized protein
MGEEIIKRYVAAVNARDLDGVLALLHPQMEWVAPGGVILRGAEQARTFLQAWLQAFPDAMYEVGAQVVGNGQAAFEATLTGTHWGTLRTQSGDIPATGRAVRVPFAAVLALDGDQIATVHLYFDLLQLLTELGMVGRY